MILKIADRPIKKTMPNGKTVKDVGIVPVVRGRPNLPEIDLTKVIFLEVPSKNSPDDPLIPWRKLVTFMEHQLRNGFVTFGTREFMAMFCDIGVDKWLQQEPPTNPWKIGSGGLIGFPDGLMRVKDTPLCYDVALWNPREGQWHTRVFDPEQGQIYPSWYNYLRLAIYPING